MKRLLTALHLFAFTALAYAGPAIEATEKQATNWHAIGMFMVFVALTMGITYWAAGRTKSTADFYTAGGGITGFQNGLAIAGDYMSAATLLGLTAMTYTQGYDAYIYMLAFFVGWPVILFLMAERLRNLGKFTFADITSYRLDQGKVRTMAAVSSLTVVCFYLIAQMVGAGNLIKLMFGIPYELAVVIVGCVMLLYVLFGGMIATTWVQIIKAGLLLMGATLLALVVLSKFGWSPLALFDAAREKYGDATLAPGKLVSNPLEAVSLGIALMFGTAGLPHILMRFYTVKDAKTARKSVFYATGLIGFFYLVTFILGFGASVLVGRGAITAIDKGGNMAAPALAEVLGGNSFLGFISAVAFATILAVVAGLTLSGAAALSHDLWTHVVKKGNCPEKEQLSVARKATVGLAILAILLGIIFKGQNVAFMVGLAFAIAASANFPALVLSMMWRGFTTRGAVASMVTGTVSAITLIVLSPTVMVDLLGAKESISPLKNPGIITVPLSFLVGILVSLWKPEPAAQEGYSGAEQRMTLGPSAVEAMEEKHS